MSGDSNLTGFGSHSAREVEELQKALGLGGAGGNDPMVTGDNVSYATSAANAFSDGNALAVEDLDRTLKLVTHGLEHLRLWKDIIKERVPQVVHEYNIQNSYGDEVPVFFQMGGVPTNTDAGYNRDVIQVKYLGTQGSVLHNLTLIQAAHGPVVAREVKNKTIELLSRNERAMFEADEAIYVHEYDGIEKQIITKDGDLQYVSSAFASYGNSISDSVVIDAAGNDFDEDIAEDAALLAVNNFGMPMDLYLGTDIHSAFSRAFYAKQRTVPGESLTSGNRVSEHMGTLDFRFKPSLFNRPRKGHVIVDATLALPTGIAQAGSGTTSYLAASVGENGEGNIGVAFTGDDGAAIEFTVGAVSAGSLYYNIYKGTTSANAVFVGRISNITASAAPARTLDTRFAGSGKAFLLMHDPDVICWKQLGSMIKYDLAVDDTSYKWLQLLYGTPLVMAPRKNVIISNLNS